MVVVAAYFTYLAVSALVAPVSARRRVVAFATAAAVVGVAFAAGMWHVLPFFYLIAGYWVPALLAGTISHGLERRLLAFDAEVFGHGGVTSFENRLSRSLVEYLEGAYLLCYVVPPVGWALLTLNGHTDQYPLFWGTVLGAAFVCYGPLPWALTRPPRAIERAPAAQRSAVREWNVAVLQRVSVQWNTFPSGHTAVSLATALALLPTMPAAAAVLVVVSLSIAAGSVLGRYHYTGDAIAGALVAVGAYVTATAVLAA